MQPLYSCFLRDGVAHGGGFGFLFFFSFGLDELMTALREHMRNLNVDSIIVMKVAKVMGNLESWLWPRSTPR